MRHYYLYIALAQLQKIIYSALKDGARWPVLCNVSVGENRYNLERHLSQAFKMFMPFIPMLRIYLKEIILSVGKYGNIMKGKDIGNRPIYKNWAMIQQ